MTQIKRRHSEGGSAFPRPAFYHEAMGEHDCVAHEGMTLRDWFAGQAMAAYVREDLRRPGKSMAPSTALHVARLCYQMADAMIEVQERDRH